MNNRINYNDYFNILKYIRGENINFANNKIESIINQQKDISFNFYEKVIDQRTYRDLLKKLLKEWYAAHKSLFTINRGNSDVNIVNTDLLLASFGYTLSAYHSPDQKKKLCTLINNIFARKCEPKVIADMLSVLNINNVYIFEFWLMNRNDPMQYDPSKLSLHAETCYRSGSLYISDQTIDGIEIPLSEVISRDNHWYMTPQEIIDADKELDIKLPSLTPYFGLGICENILDKRAPIAFISRKIRDAYNTWLYGNPHQTEGNIHDPVGYNPDDPQQELQCGDPLLSEPVGTLDRYIPIEGYGNVVSLLELVMGISIAAFAYDEIKDPSYPMSTNMKHCETRLDISDVTMFIDEYNNVHKMPETRQERENLLIQQNQKFITNNPYLFANLDDTETLQLIMKKMNPAFYEHGKFYMQNDMIITLFRDLITALDDAMIAFGFPPTNFILNLGDYPNGMNHIKKIIDFIKPYQSRLIKMYYAFEIRDLPGDAFRIDDSTNRVINPGHHVFPSEMGFKEEFQLRYMTSTKDVFKVRIQKKFQDFIGFRYMAPNSQNFSHILNIRDVLEYQINYV